MHVLSTTVEGYLPQKAIKLSNKQSVERKSFQELYQRFGWEDDFHNDSLSRWQKLKPKMWRLFDEPSSSRGAKVSHAQLHVSPFYIGTFQVIAIISVFFLITAILVFCLKTHPGLRISEIASIGNLSREARAASHYRYRPAPVTVDKTNSKAHPGFMVSYCSLSSSSHRLNCML